MPMPPCSTPRVLPRRPGNPNQSGGLFRTTDRGLSWSKIFNTHDVESVTANLSDANEIYLGTKSNGLWHSSNARAATPTFDEVTSYPYRHPTRIFFNPYNANEIWTTTGGNGLRVGLSPVAPGAPIMGMVVAGNRQATVSFSAPASNGGSAITGYTATCAATGHATQTGSGSGSPITVSGRPTVLHIRARSLRLTV